MTTTNSTNTATTTSPRRGRPSVAEIRERTLHADRLWVLEDVATFLGFSIRLTEQIVRDPRVPQPRLVSRGGERRWSPTHWQQWMGCGDITWLGESVDGADTAPTDDTEMGAI